jgi:hypothetical protein
MWQSRDETIALCDQSADEITALRARLEAMEKERDNETIKRAGWELKARIAEARAEAAEAALATARLDALEEAVSASRKARETVIHSSRFKFLAGVRKGHDRAEDAIRALANEAEEKPVDGSFSD